MGPTSGSGNPDRFHVHDFRIYLFASESCRNSFKKNPENHIDRSDAEAELGGRLMDQAVESSGGPARWRDLKSFIRVTKSITRQGKETHECVRTKWYRGVDEFATQDNCKTVRYGYSVGPKVRHQSDDSRPVDDEVRASLLRSLRREPMTILRHWATKSKPDGGPIKVLALKSKETVSIADQKVDRVVFRLGDATATLEIDRRTGLIVASKRLGRAGGLIDVVRKEYDDYSDVNGIKAPFRETIRLGGLPIVNLPESTFESIEVDGSIDPKLFDATKIA
jgi:hypothetical protein